MIAAVYRHLIPRRACVVGSISIIGIAARNRVQIASQSVEPFAEMPLFLRQLAGHVAGELTIQESPRRLVVPFYNTPIPLRRDDRAAGVYAEVRHPEGEQVVRHRKPGRPSIEHRRRRLCLDAGVPIGVSDETPIAGQVIDPADLGPR